MAEKGKGRGNPIDFSQPDAFTIIALPSLFVLVPLLPFTLYNTVQQLWRMTWNEVPGTVVTSAYVPGRGKHAPNQSRVAFEYTVHDVQYTSPTWSLSPLSGFMVSSAVDEYRVGDRVWVYYEPGNPARAVLQVGLAVADVGLLVLVLLMSAIGAGWIWKWKLARSA